MFIIGFILAFVSVVTLGTFGDTYPIKEKDALLEIEEKIKQIDAEKIRTELEYKFRNYKPDDWRNLGPADKDYSYLVDLTYTLDVDIPRIGENGNIEGVLYPKGYSFNPLDYTPVDPTPLVVFNGDSKEEKEWVKKYCGNGCNAMLVITEGTFSKVAEELQRPVYYLKEIMAKKLKLKNTISVVKREGNKMRVNVYSVKKRKS